MARPRLTERRRLQTLQAAVEVISERGLCDTRIADVAERAGSSAALVLYYFGTKDRLLTEALAFAEDRFYLDTFHELTELERPADRLVYLIDRACPNPEPGEDGDWHLWVEMWSRARRDPEAARKREALDKRWRQTIEEIVRDGQKAGDFADVSPDDFAYRFAALIDGLAIQLLLGDPSISRDRMKAICLDVVERELEPSPNATHRASGRGG